MHTAPARHAKAWRRPGRRSTRHAGTAQHGHARAYGSTINRLARQRTARLRPHLGLLRGAGTRSRGLSGPASNLLLLLESGHHVRPRGYDGPCRQVSATATRGGHRRTRRHWRARRHHGSGRTWLQRRALRHRRHPRRGRRQRLSWPRKNLSGPRSGGHRGRNRRARRGSRGGRRRSSRAQRNGGSGRPRHRGSGGYRRSRMGRWRTGGRRRLWRSEGWGYRDRRRPSANCQGRAERRRDRHSRAFFRLGRRRSRRGNNCCRHGGGSGDGRCRGGDRNRGSGRDNGNDCRRRRRWGTHDNRWLRDSGCGQWRRQRPRSFDDGAGQVFYFCGLRHGCTGGGVHHRNGGVLVFSLMGGRFVFGIVARVATRR